MRSFFANLDSLTIPTSAGPGDTRVVFGGELPPPLDTYTFSSVSGTYRYASAIIFYRGGGNDDNYEYIAAIEQLTGAITAVLWHQGAVVNGAVVESSAGVPDVFESYDTLSGLTSVRGIRGKELRLEAASLALRLYMTASGSIAVENDSGFGSITLERTADQDRVLLHSGGILVTTQVSGHPIELNAGSSGQIVVSSDIDWAGSTTVTSGLLNSGGSGTASTSYVNLGSPEGVAFVAPPSGKVSINWGTRISNNVAGNAGFCTIQVRSGTTVGSGTIISAAADAPAARHVGVDLDKWTRSTPISGLVAGSNYNVQLLFRSSAGANTAFFNDYDVTVSPQL